MPIIATIGRKQPKARLLIAVMYVVLAVGAVTMVYPFLLMISSSFTSPVDMNEFTIVPRYFHSDDVLYRKYIESKYNEDVVKYNIRFGTDWTKFENVKAPRRVNRKFIGEWRRFVAGLPPDYLTLGHSATAARNMKAEIEITYRSFAAARFHGDLAKLNKTYKEANESWMDLQMPVEDWTLRNFTPVRSLKYQEFLRFKREQPARYRITVGIDGLFEEYLRLKYGNIQAIDKALGARYRSRDQIHLPDRVPGAPSAAEWETFVRNECPVHYIAIDSQATAAFRESIRRKYTSIGLYNRAYKTRFASFAEIGLPRRAPAGGILLVDWIEFLGNAVPIRMVELRTPETLFQSRLARDFHDVAAMNTRLGTSFGSFEEVAPPYAGNDLLEMREDRHAIRTEFIVRNYREVLNYIALHGRAVLNTAILCIAIVFTSLIVNPLCAYALSRFNLRSTYKILLFLLATMAFPAEVSAIPSFLLVKQLHLLGTYWAIILPGLASGFSIFLLKGFFDSLPKELYEAAIIDGANELQMFWTITLKLSKPILAVIALGAFTGAYGSFMWAFLVCQNQKMWTLMVWLYQMQTWAPSYVIYASLVLAAIPTLLVFVFCQNIIMRGIIVPSEK